MANEDFSFPLSNCIPTPYTDSVKDALGAVLAFVDETIDVKELNARFNDVYHRDALDGHEAEHGGPSAQNEFSVLVVAVVQSVFDEVGMKPPTAFRDALLTRMARLTLRFASETIEEIPGEE